MSSSFPLLNLPSEAITHVLKSMDYREFITLSFLSKRAKCSVESMNLESRILNVVIGNPVYIDNPSMFEIGEIRSTFEPFDKLFISRTLGLDDYLESVLKNFQPYAPGEVIPITIDIDNTSKRPAYCVRAELHQHSHYHASFHSLLGTCSSHHEHHKDDSKRVVESRKNIIIAAKSQGREELKMKFPNLTPTFECPIISVEYCLSVKLDTETSMNNTLHCEFNIIIGTIPANQSQPIVLSSSASSVPSAPPAIERTESMSPPYFLVPSTNMGNDNAGPSAPPPSYEESVSITKI